jgi:hypothetical protein
MKHVKTLCEKNAEFIFNVRRGSTYNYHCVLYQGWIDFCVASAAYKLPRTPLYLFNLTQVLLLGNMTILIHTRTQV